MCGTSPPTVEALAAEHGVRRRKARPGCRSLRPLGTLRLRLAVLAFLFATQAAAGGLPPPVAAALAEAGVPGEAVALYVAEPGAAPLLSHNADRPMNPASVIKLVTTYAALETLGPAYRWRTEIYATGPLRRERLDGDLVMKGYGDPKLTLEALWLWLRDLRARGLRDIRGKLVVDRSFFDLPREDPGAFDGQPQKPYNAPPDALLVNFQSWPIEFVPEENGQRVRVALPVGIPGLRLGDEVTAVAGPCGDWKEGIRTELGTTRGGLVLRVRGSYPAACGAQVLNRVLFGPDTQLAALFGSLWRELGGRWQGKVVEGRVPDGARLVARNESPPLSDVVRDINKFSNNVMARQLYLTLGAELLGPPATLEKAAQATEAVLASRGLRFLELEMGNGAGLDRKTRVSARHLARLLEAALVSPWFAEFESSLPIVAVDGTMRRRLTESSLAGRARIKSGSLDGVRAIAGYVRTAEGRRRVVVAIVNHARAEQARAALDAVLHWAGEAAPGASAAEGGVPGREKDSPGPR